MNNITTLKTKYQRGQEALEEIQNKYPYDLEKALIGCMLCSGESNVVGGIDYTLADRDEYIEEYRKKLSYETEYEAWKAEYISEKEVEYRRKLITGDSE